MVENNLKQLEENLIKENGVLERLLALCDEQIKLLDDLYMEVEVFDEYMEKQEELLQEITALDEKTEMLYESLRTETLMLDGPYAQRIEKIQVLVPDIMNKTKILQEKEQIKKQKLDVYFESERKSLGSDRRTSKAALDYYMNMNRSNVIPPQFMDQKK